MTLSLKGAYSEDVVSKTAPRQITYLFYLNSPGHKPKPDFAQSPIRLLDEGANRAMEIESPFDIPGIV